MISKTFSGFTSTAALPTTSGIDEVLEVNTRRAMRHRLQRRQAEAFVERRENENLGYIVENPQHVNRNKAQKAHIVLHSASDDRAAQVGMFGEFVPDDDQLQVRKFLLLSPIRRAAENASMMRTRFLCGLIRPA